MKRERMGRHAIVAIVMILAFALLVTGCGAPDRMKANQAESIAMDVQFTSSGANMANVPSAPPMYSQEMKKDGSAGYGAIALEEVARKIIRNANIEQKVTDLDEATDKVMQLVADSRGYLQSSSIREYSERERVASYVLRIPEASYDTVLMQIRQIGKNVNIGESGTDVTEEYYDNEARIKNLQLQEAAVQKLFDRADKMEDILAIQKELFAIRGDIESLQGRNRYLDNLTSLSTIELTIREVKPVEYLKEEDESALSRAKEGFIDSLGALSRFFIELFVYVVSALPVLIILVVAVAIALWVFLKRRKNKARTPDDSNDNAQ